MNKLQSKDVFIGKDIRDVSTRLNATSENQKVKTSISKRSHQTFGMINIPIGTQLSFTLDRSIKATTVDNKKKYGFRMEVCWQYQRLREFYVSKKNMPIAQNAARHTGR